MKRIVICSDGTWNSVENGVAGGRLTSTNVAKLATLIDVEAVDGDSTEQIVYYQEGVGTGEEDQVSGGAFGWGLYANVQAAYRFIVENFNPGDELFFFGFSRGAYTVRSLAGLIRCCGVVKRNDDAERMVQLMD